MVRIYVLFNLALIVSSMLTFLNKFKKSIPLAAGFVNLVVANVIYWSQLSGEAVLWNSFGVKLILDNISRDFLLMNSIVFLASTIVATKKEKPSVFFFLLALFLPSCNLMFLSCDMFNIYVLLELTTLVVFLLASFGGKTNQVWSALKYMVLGTAGMNLYLLGVGMIFARSRTFELPTLVDIIPAVLVISGLLVKAGVFLFSMWLPDLHSSVESELSALLSGVGIKTAVYAILRFSPSLGKTVDVVVLFGVVSAIAGVVFALNERSYKRILAYHTLSQVGFVLSAPAVGSFYALAHGVFKSWLFLNAEELPVKDSKKLSREKLPFLVWLAVVLPCLTICGLPFTIGATAKHMVFSQLTSWQKIFMYGAAVGTVISFSKFLFLRPTFEMTRPVNPLVHILLGFYCFFPSLVLSVKGAEIFKSLIVLGVGALIYFILKNRTKPLPRRLENLEDSLTIYVLLIAVCFLVVIVRG